MASKSPTLCSTDICTSRLPACLTLCLWARVEPLPRWQGEAAPLTSQSPAVSLPLLPKAMSQSRRAPSQDHAPPHAGCRQRDGLQRPCQEPGAREAGCGMAGIAIPMARSSPPHYFLFTKPIQSNGEHTCLRLQLKKMRPYIANCLCIIPDLRICVKTKHLWSISKWQRFYRLCNTKTRFLKMRHIKPQLPGKKEYC